MPAVQSRPYGQAAVLDASGWADVLAVADARETALVRLQLATFGRISEVVALRWSDVDGDRLHLQRSKGGPATVIDLPQAAVDALRVWRSQCDSTVWIFPGRKVQNRRRSCLSRRAAIDLWDALADRAGVPALRSHSARRSAATAASRAGVPLPAIQAAGGWRSLSSLQRYLIADPADVKRARDLL